MTFLAPGCPCSRQGRRIPVCSSPVLPWSAIPIRRSTTHAPRIEDAGRIELVLQPARKVCERRRLWLEHRHDGPGSGIGADSASRGRRRPRRQRRVRSSTIGSAPGIISQTRPPAQSKKAFAPSAFAANRGDNGGTVGPEQRKCATAAKAECRRRRVCAQEDGAPERLSRRARPSRSALPEGPQHLGEHAGPRLYRRAEAFQPHDGGSLAQSLDAETSGDVGRQVRGAGDF